MTAPKFRLGQVVRVLSVTHGQKYLGNGTVKRIQEKLGGGFTYRISGRQGDIEESRLRDTTQHANPSHEIGYVTLEQMLALELEDRGNARAG